MAARSASKSEMPFASHTTASPSIVTELTGSLRIALL
jgi:hypothetical protein